MKKHILLTTTAMLLSAITLNANAEPSNSAQLRVSATFVKPLELISEKYLGFGMILADEGGKTVIVKTDGTLDSNSTATMMSTASFTNNESASFNEGIIRVVGGIIDDIDGEASEFVNVNEETLNYLISINISDKQLELKSKTDSVTCGTVTDFNSKITVEGEDALIHVGGTLTTANLSGQSRSLLCDGYTTVTIVHNEENFANIMNNLP